VNYQVALHRYSVPSQWDRVSHQGDMTLTIRPARWLAWQSAGEISIRGSADDRDLSDVYQAGQAISLRLARGSEVDLGASWRLRRYGDGAGRDATNRYVEAEFKQRMQRFGRMTMGARYETNRADSTRYRYHRLTYSLGFSTPSEAPNSVEFGLKYRDQRYDSRRVEVDGRHPRRRDYRLTPSIGYTRRLGQSLEVALGYEYEVRSSNDASKEYSAHQVGLSVTRRW
jgi:hypothetical protein